MPRLGRKLKPTPYESAKNAKNTLLADLKTIAYIKQHGTEKDIEDIKNGLINALEKIQEISYPEMLESEFTWAVV